MMLQKGLHIELSHTWVIVASEVMGGEAGNTSSKSRTCPMSLQLKGVGKLGMEGCAVKSGHFFFVFK